MSQLRVLVGCSTYVIGKYHFNNGVPLPVKDEDVEMIDGLTSDDGEKMFSEPETESDSVEEQAPTDLDAEVQAGDKKPGKKLIVGGKGASSDGEKAVTV